MASPEALDFLLTRRSRPAKLLSAPGPDRAEVLRLLTAAARVPDHGKLEPWRFVVLEGAGLARWAAAIRARAEVTGQDADKGALAFEQAPLSIAVVALAEAEREDPADRADAVGRRGGARAAERLPGGRLGGELADRLGGLRPGAGRGRARARARGVGRGLRPRRHVRHAAAGPAAAGRGGAHHLDRRVSLVVDLGRALAQFGDPRFRRVLWRALGLTVVALAAVTWAVLLLLGWLLPESVTLPWIGPVGFLDEVAFWGALGLMLVLSVVLMVPAAAAVVGFFLDEVAAAVEARYYPALPPAVEMGLGEQVAEAARFFGLVVLVNAVALAIYLAVPPLAPFVFWLVNGFLLGREYFGLVATRRLGRAGSDAARAGEPRADLARRDGDGGAAERAGPEPLRADRRRRGLHPPVPQAGARLSPAHVGLRNVRRRINLLKNKDYAGGVHEVLDCVDAPQRDVPRASATHCIHCHVAKFNQVSEGDASICARQDGAAS